MYVPRIVSEAFAHYISIVCTHATGATAFWQTCSLFLFPSVGIGHEGGHDLRTPQYFTGVLPPHRCTRLEVRSHLRPVQARPTHNLALQTEIQSSPSAINPLTRPPENFSAKSSTVLPSSLPSVFTGGTTHPTPQLTFPASCCSALSHHTPTRPRTHFSL